MTYSERSSDNEQDSSNGNDNDYKSGSGKQEQAPRPGAAISCSYRSMEQLIDEEQAAAAARAPYCACNAVACSAEGGTEGYCDRRSPPNSSSVLRADPMATDGTESRSSRHLKKRKRKSERPFYFPLPPFLSFSHK